MKYTIGDKVRIKSNLKESNLKVGHCYGIKDRETFISEMRKYQNKIACITYRLLDTYKLDIDKGVWWWTDEMLEPVNKNVSDGHIQYILNGDKTIVIEHYTDEEGDHKYRKGIARRNPIDLYNKALGLIMAIADSYGIDKNMVHIGESECNNINKEEENFIKRFKTEKIAVNVQSIEENNKIVQLFKKYKKQLNTNDTDIYYFNQFDKVCYCYTFFNELGYSMNKNFYKSEGFKIIPFSDIFKEGISLVEISTEDLLSELKNRINK